MKVTRPTTVIELNDDETAMLLRLLEYTDAYAAGRLSMAFTGEDLGNFCDALMVSLQGVE